MEDLASQLVRGAKCFHPFKNGKKGRGEVTNSFTLSARGWGGGARKG